LCRKAEYDIFQSRTSSGEAAFGLHSSLQPPILLGLSSGQRRCEPAEFYHFHAFGERVGYRPRPPAVSATNAVGDERSRERTTMKRNKMLAFTAAALVLMKEGFLS
jgi:hypothetical protein